MDITVSKTLPAKSKNTCLLVGMCGKSMSATAQQIDKAGDGVLTRLVKRGDIKGTAGECVTVLDATGSGYERIVVVGFGATDKLTRTSYLKSLTLAFAAAKKTAAVTWISALSEVEINHPDESQSDIGDKPSHAESWKISQQARLMRDSQYKFTGHKTGKKTSNQKSQATKGTLLVTQSTPRAARDAAKQGSAIATGCAVARDLGNLAANICTPSYLATLARQYGRKHEQLKVNILGEKQIEKLGMGAFMAVSRGSRQEGKLFLMEYRGAAKSSKPVSYTHLTLPTKA